MRPLVLEAKALWSPTTGLPAGLLCPRLATNKATHYNLLAIELSKTVISKEFKILKFVFLKDVLLSVAPLKQEIKKPSRITKQKATTNLQKINEPSSRITRRSAEKIEEKPVESMEQDVTQVSHFRPFSYLEVKRKFSFAED